jgi:hypothetical protein
MFVVVRPLRSTNYLESKKYLQANRCASDFAAGTATMYGVCVTNDHNVAEVYFRKCTKLNSY